MPYKRKTFEQASLKALHGRHDMQIYVFLRNGVTLTLEVKDSETIDNVKTMISDILVGQIRPDQQLLTFAGRELQDDMTLSHYNIQNKSTLHVVTRRSTTPDPYTHVETPTRVTTPVRYITMAEFLAGSSLGSSRA